MNLEDKLKDRKRMLEIELEKEQHYVDKKGGVPEMRLKYLLGKVEGALISIDYMKIQIKYEWIKED